MIATFRRLFFGICLSVCAGAVLGGGAALAAAGPDYPIEAFCKKLASVGGDYSAVVYDTCLDQQKSARQDVTRRWAQLPENVRFFCNRVATLGGAGDYSMLDDCINKKMGTGDGKPTLPEKKQ